MVRSLPSGAKLPIFVSSLKRGHVHCHLLEQRSHMRSYGVQIITHITHFCSSFITFLIPKGHLSGKLLETRALVSAGRRTAAARKQLPVTGLTARTPWEVICRTREMQPLDLTAFHTIPVQTETTAPNTSQRRTGLDSLLYFVHARCRWRPWLALMCLQHLI